MHDIDRVQLETGMDEMESEFEFADEFETDGGEFEGGESPFTEAQEMELAAELLEIGDEFELDQFLGKLIRKARQVVGRAIPPSILRPLGGLLKGAVKKALPGVASTIGSAIGGPAGGAIAGRIAPMASRLFGLELEGMSGEDQEFEVARRLVRFAGSAAQQANGSAPNGASPAAQQAVVGAARQHAPGFLVGGSAPQAGAMRRRSGRWVRRGRKIIILGL